MVKMINIRVCEESFKRSGSCALKYTTKPATKFKIDATSADAESLV